MEMLLSELAGRGIKNHFLGSFTWADQVVKKITEWNETQMKFELVGTPVEIKQSLSAETEAACEALGKAMFAYHHRFHKYKSVQLRSLAEFQRLNASALVIFSILENLYIILSFAMIHFLFLFLKIFFGFFSYIKFHLLRLIGFLNKILTLTNVNKFSFASLNRIFK